MSNFNGENIHSGHRQRVRNEFSENGAINFSDIRALELLLFYSIPRGDTNPLAHTLLNRFGSLHNIFSASYQELLNVPGVGQQTAVLLKLVPDIYLKAEIEKSRREKKSLSCTNSAAEYLKSYFQNTREEQFAVLSLNPKKELIRCDIIAKGIVNRVNIDIRKIVETALTNKATSIIISHNHPDGNPVPSKEDIALTDRIADALATVGIPLNDHLIYSDGSVFSFFEKGLL